MFSPNYLLPEESSLQGTFAARVAGIILDESDELYLEYGKNDSIGTIFYIPIGVDYTKKDLRDLPVAKPLDGSTRTYPLKDEIVLITSAPSSILTDRDKVAYYTRIVSVWNNPNHNAFPPTKDLDLGYEVEEQRMSPLQPFYGDTIFEGRSGQTIRLSGEKHPKNIYTDDSNKGKPFIIISNGQVLEKGGNNFTVEDINKDDSSIFLTSDHTVPLKQSRDKYKAADIEPINAEKYKGKQIILNSGRLYFNSKEEDILFSAKESFGVSSKDVSIDGKDYIGLDAKKIYIGKKALDFESQPAVLGDKLEYFLNTMLKELVTLGKIMTKANAMGKPIPALNKRGPAFAAIFRSLQSRINPGNTKSGLKSKKVFSE